MFANTKSFPEAKAGENWELGEKRRNASVKRRGRRKGIFICVFLEDCRSVMDVTRCSDVCLHLQSARNNTFEVKTASSSVTGC